MELEDAGTAIFEAWIGGGTAQQEEEEAYLAIHSETKIFDHSVSYWDVLVCSEVCDIVRKKRVPREAAALMQRSKPSRGRDKLS